ncbi:hypothetical protein TNCV_1842651 [Trichonephila clavipes]|nr:hypothetical protein TNCV_1842651 [Trichonephila clavipes]
MAICHGPRNSEPRSSVEKDTSPLVPRFPNFHSKTVSQLARCVIAIVPVQASTTIHHRYSFSQKAAVGRAGMCDWPQEVLRRFWSRLKCPPVGLEVRRGECQLRCVLHLTMAQTYEAPCQKPSSSYIVRHQHSLTHRNNMRAICDEPPNSEPRLDETRAGPLISEIPHDANVKDIDPRQTERAPARLQVASELESVTRQRRLRIFDYYH